jgi:hypothetical protein
LLVEADRARWRVIDANRAEEDVWSEVWLAVASSELLAKVPNPTLTERARGRPK